MKHLIHILSLLLLPLLMRAQQGVYIAPGARIQVHSGEVVSIYGNVVNDGGFGSGQSSVINFFGKSWSNGTGGTLPDESANGFSGRGGLFRFSGNNPLYGNLGAQQLFGGYNVSSRLGATFPNFEVNNRLGILLADLSDMKVRNNLHFSSGHLFLNGWNLVVGNGNPGTITGYSEQSFIITGSSIAGGFVYREQVNAAAGRVVFPIGTSPATYAPAAIEYAGTADDFRARVFDSVYQFAISGLVNKLDFTNKTWNMARGRTDVAEASLTLQHMDADEGRDYASYRAASYVTRFVNNSWDYLEPETFPAAGNITTTATLRNATMHVRRFRDGIRNNEYFTKASILYGPYAPAVFIYFNAWRLNENFAQLEWSVSRELNNAYFEIERRLDTDTGFMKVGQLGSMAPNGNINTRLDYRYVDPNNYDGWSYYRIKAVARSNGRVSYSEIKAVPPFLRIEVFPNPNRGQFTVRVRGEQTAITMHLVNSLGQLIEQFTIEGTRDLRVEALAKGTYLLVFYEKGTNRLMRTHKVVVIDR